MRKKILRLFSEKGFLLDRSSLEFLSGFNEKVICDVVDVLVKEGVKEKLIRKEFFEGNKEKFKMLFSDLPRGNIEILSDFGVSSGKLKLKDFVNFFRNRYEKIREKFGDFDGLTSIRRIGSEGSYKLVGMVFSKRFSRAGNLLFEVEDLTGRILVLVNRENKNLFSIAEGLMLDDVVLFSVSGSSKMLFVNDVVFPECVLEKERFGEVDEYIAFSGDFHVGSNCFLEKNLLRFVDWLNGEVGDERMREMGRKVKYLLLSGDLVDGVGVYSGQERFLDIKNYVEQYKKVEEILRKIRDDVQIVVCPGQHDASWVGEPQRIIREDLASGLYGMNNLFMVTNPALVGIRGFKILMYHGASLNRFIDSMSDLRVGVGHSSPVSVVKKILERSHLAPSYGVMDYNLSGGVDNLVIDSVPDILATGDQHRAEVGSYNNILMIASSCWQSSTPFEEKMGISSESCKVPLFNLKTREVKILDFSSKKNSAQMNTDEHRFFLGGGNNENSD